MRNKKISVTIGIPVYNEAFNITNILLKLLRQNQTFYDLKKIVVVSDKSTDRTNELIKKINNEKIILLTNSERKGKSFCLDKIINKTNSDILVIIDADTTLTDFNFIDKICLPIIAGKADLTSPIVQELKPKTFIQEILYASMEFKRNIYYYLNAGINVYTCHGRALAFSKKLYKSIRFTGVIVDDAFSYFFCKYNNFKFLPVISTSIFYALPASFSDHEKQSIRFFKSLDNLSYKYPNKDIKSEYIIPGGVVIKALLKTLFKYPIILAYFPIAFFMKIKSLLINFQSVKWDISKSSKLIEL